MGWWGFGVVDFYCGREEGYLGCEDVVLRLELTFNV